MREDQKAVFRALRPRLTRACRGYLGELEAEAEDLVQDAWMLAGHRVDPAAPAEATAAWLLQVCLQLCGARRRSPEGVVRCLEVELERARQSRAIERVDSGDLEAQKQQCLVLLREAIKPLNLEDRQVLQLRNVKGFSYAQVGATLELSWPAVARRLDHARGEMRRSLGLDLAVPAPSNLTCGPWAARAT